MAVLRHDQAPPDPAVLGGKGANLARLRDLGARVPAWLCLSAREPAAGLSPEEEQALLAEASRLFPDGARLAVRSSAVSEDSARDSFAGQMETFLHVPRGLVVDRVRDVLASASSERARAYREARGLAAADAKAAVVVQLMVEARVSGVLFTANPATGDASEAVISAGLGLGEGVVADKVETDTYYVDLASGEVRAREIAPKRTRVAFDRGRGAGTLVEAVPPEEGDRPTLSDAEACELVVLASRLAEGLGAPQDIEWSIDRDGVVHLLQTRPITTLDCEQVFDNSNIVESYPGISLPLTFSFARQAYEQAFREASQRFGVPEETLAANRRVHANLLALIDGRIYYNILNWYRLFEMLPGTESLLPAWEKALGLKRRFVRPRRGSLLHRLRSVPHIAATVARLTRRFLRLRAHVDGYQQTFHAVREEFRNTDLARLNPHELFELYDTLCRRLLAGYAISPENDLFAQQAYELLFRLIARWGLGDPSTLRNELLCGEKGMESVEPVRSALRLAERARRSPRLMEVLESSRSEPEVLAVLKEDAELGPAIAEHLDRYGDRTLQELKLETPLAEDEPGLLISTLRNLARGGRNVEEMEERERRIRATAEEQIAGALRNPLRRWLFSLVLHTCRLTVRQREDLRLTRSRAFGMVKRVFRAMGLALARAALIAAPIDIFWLTVEEVEGVLSARLVTRDLRAIVTQRKQEYEGHRRRTPAPRITTRGIPYLSAFEQAGSAPSIAGDVLRGIGCSPGRVCARAKVVRAPDRGVDVQGEVLIAPMTDPGWVFLMVAAGGLVVEKGSVLSHTAIIGRELGIPTVVAVKDATRLIPDGALVELDGQSGTVRIVER